MAKGVYESYSYSTYVISSNDGVLLKKKSGYSNILQRSIDSGKTWSDVYDFTVSIQFFIITNDGSYIVSVGSDVFDSTPGEIWKSEDDGITFNKVLTLDSGGALYWSFAYDDDIILCCEYGHYPSRNVWASYDDGDSWIKIFTHPVSEGLVHIHSVSLSGNYIVITCGDVDGRGIFFSSDKGINFTQVVTGNPQCIQAIFINDNIFLASDNATGNIYVDSISNFANNSVSLNVAFDGVANGNKSQVYGFTKDKNGTIYAASNDEANSNFGNPYLIASYDDGVTWSKIKEYTKESGLTKGVYYLSDASKDDSRIFIASLLDPAIYNYFKEISTLTIKSS